MIVDNRGKVGFLLIFDMDGTLIDSEQSIVRCFRESAGKFGYDVGDISQYIGVLKLTQILVKHGVRAKDLPEVMKSYRDCYLGTFASDTKPIGNSPLVLKQLQDKNELGILTLKNLELTLEITKRYFPGVDFRYIVCGDRPIENKVEGLKMIMEESGKDPDHIFYIGDRASDVKSAKEAGIEPIWVSFGLGKISDFDSVTDFPIANSFDDLLEMFSSRT
ncbi:MAG: HAD hydrolase-like protein [Candidatus Thermoplasmatota archaeon]|jgi:phosphoglycolate phosphatase|nr:HAD hydrolase-like protein [Candidatus Thermoplasmatota archaeon]